jgi:hypothetical protein
MTIYTCTTCLFACLASFIVSSGRNRWDPFRGFHGFGIAKLNLWREYSTRDMDPIVICGTLQWFSGIDGLVEFLLLLSEVICDLQSVFSLDSITLALFFGLLLMRDLWGFHEILLCMLHGTEHTFILLNSLVPEE